MIRARRDGRSITAAGLLDVDWGDGCHQLGGPSQVGGDTLIWLARLLGLDTSDRPALAFGLEALLAAPRDAQPLIFLPYLQGERVPYWDSDLRGAFVGLNRDHHNHDLLTSVIESIVFHNKIILNQCEYALGDKIAAVRFGGGGAASSRWAQVKADVLQLRGIGKSYGAVTALADVDLDVARGEVLAICGDNGAGKSTLIKIVAGAERPSAGTLLDLSTRRIERLSLQGLFPIALPHDSSLPDCHHEAFLWFRGGR